MNMPPIRKDAYYTPITVAGQRRKFQKAGKIALDKTCTAFAAVLSLALPFRKPNLNPDYTRLEETNVDADVESEAVETKNDETKKGIGFVLRNAARKQAKSDPMEEPLLYTEEFGIHIGRKEPESNAKI